MADRPPLKRQADAAFKQKQYTTAIEAYTRLLEEDPTQLVCWLNIGAAYLEKREWEKAREACEKFLKLTPDEGAEGASAAQRAKAHYRMALACLELGLKDATAFGPAIYFRNTARDAERAWALAEGSPGLRQPIADLLRRLRDQLRRLQQTAAHQAPPAAPAPDAPPPLVEPRPIEDAGVPGQPGDLAGWGAAWVRALAGNLDAGPDALRAADVADLLAKACLPDHAAALLAALAEGTEGSALYRPQLQLCLSRRAAAWPADAYRALSRADWLLPPHCLGRFTAPARVVGEAGDAGRLGSQLVAFLIQGLADPPIDVSGTDSDAAVLKEWLISQPPGVVSIYDDVRLDTTGPATLHIDLPRFEVVAGHASQLWLFDFGRGVAVAEPLLVATLQEPGRPGWGRPSR